MANGRHLILDLDGCDPVVLDSYGLLLDYLCDAMKISGAKVLQIIGEKFKPTGVTVLALLSESHSSIHTWPEIGYAAVDLYTCNADNTNTEKAAQFLIKKLKAKQVNQKDIDRYSTSEDICASFCKE
jgi:S-adenosylmethionine decarboxylase